MLWDFQNDHPTVGSSQHRTVQRAIRFPSFTLFVVRHSGSLFAATTNNLRASDAIATMSCSEIACTYACLILHDDGIAITAEKIAALVKAANVSVEGYWPSLFAKLCEKRSVDDLITNVGSGGGGAAVAVSAAPAASAAGAEAPKEVEKEEPKEESDDDMGFSLFD